jgi:hypothetical protein
MGLRAREHLKLCLVLLVLATISTIGMMSCGSGGGGSDGGVCSQCGDTDGPCLPGSTVIPSGDRTPGLICTSPGPCSVMLVCARELGSAQRRCYPAKGPALSDLDLAFECDGARPNPHMATPVPTFTGPTLTPGLTVTPTPVFL